MAPVSVSAAKLWIVLARCHRALATSVERSITDLGLCLSDFMVLEALLHKGPLTISEIQAKVLLASGSMTAAIDRVEKMGLVIRKTTAEDRRVIERAFRQHAQHLESAMSVLDEEERRHLRAGLKKLGKSVAATLDRPHAKGTYE